jgi:hypothetical protein
VLSTEEWTVLASIASSSVVAAFLTYFFKVRAESQERSAAKQALQAEIDHIEEHARGYLRIATPRSPSWRPSTLIYPHAITRLIALGAVNAKATRSILTFYNHAHSFSRSLDMVEEVRGTAGYEREARRALIKATLLVPASHIQELLREPVLLPYLRYLQKRARVYGDRMPVDAVRRELQLVPGTPFLGF